MAAGYHSKVTRQLKPTHSLIFVSESEVAELAAAEIPWELVGQKTFGLLALPPVWTLPFFSVSFDLYKSYSTANGKRKEIVAKWSQVILKVALEKGLKRNDQILVRSSGCGEGISKRGTFYSSRGILQNLEVILDECLNALVKDADLQNERVPLLIQKACAPEKAKGHLSNERRCYKENRDWMGEMESNGSDTSSNFNINLRNWRENLPETAPAIISCSLSTRISESLKEAAKWAYRKKVRVHFEWVWDGNTVYLVQADEEIDWDGHDPVREHQGRGYGATSFVPECLKAVNSSNEYAKHFCKIANSFTYLSLGLPTAPLYFLDDLDVIRQISNGAVPDALRADITQLVKGSLVIRSDIATDDIQARQLLPRTQELREASKASDWLITQSEALLKSAHPCAFIFHNFIPARSAAFAYAAPDEPFVQVESLWGLPEGLYYNSHDKYVIDTIKPDINQVPRAAIAAFSVRERINFKHWFVSTTPSGNWETLALRAPFDWKASLTPSECQFIAYESRRIAQAEKRAVSIMWFVEIPVGVAESPAIPWYHEAFDITKGRSSISTRKKTPFDKSFLIQTQRDVDNLENGMKASAPGDRIRIQPLEEKLLRQKETLKNIGLLAKTKGAVIVLEGAVLSHAYYQLISTGAVVEVVHPFIGFDERHEFNKLVRDKVPEIIQKRGENVTTAVLDKDMLVRLLREKLIEEAYELLDAKDLQSVMAEMADVKEVLDSLIQKMDLTPGEVNDVQVKKRQERGSFMRGIVLVETEKVPPSSKPSAPTEEHLSGLQPVPNSEKVIDEAEFKKRSELLEKRTDRRVATGKLEIKATVSIPVARGPAWSLETGQEIVGSADGKAIRGRVKGIRVGNQWHIEVSVGIDNQDAEPVRTDEKQLKLL